MKFISGSYDHNTGVSTVVIQHLGVKFTGKAFLHPEDKKNVSSYAGCEYAEIRATIKALKYERMIEKNKSDMALDFIHACENYSKFNKDDNTTKVLYRQLNRRIKKVNDLTDEINNLYKELDMKIHQRPIVLKALDTRKEMSKEDN